jgi:ABC-type antimicrobial peptide transport system permease subunit
VPEIPKTARNDSVIKNLLVIALRNLRKDKWYSILNILGLTLGITFSLFLIFYIKDELNYDRSYEKADQIYRIVSYIQERDKNTNWTITQLPLAPTLKKDFPEVSESVRFFPRERTLFKQGNNEFYETKIYYADSNVFRIFTCRFIEGKPDYALNQPNSIVISKTLADKYFGKNQFVVGKTLKTVYDVYKVTGVIEDVPKNSHLIFDMLISSSTILKGAPENQGNWGNFNNFTYVLLKPGTNVKAFNKRLIPIVEKFVNPIFSKFNIKMQYDVQPITSIHLHSHLDRRTLVVLQFSISMIMLICTWVVYSQLAYLRKKDLGFDKNQVMTITVNTGEDERGKIFALNNEFRSLPGIETVGTGNAYPGNPNTNFNLFTIQTNNGHVDKAIECYGIDENFAKALSIPVTQGRNFTGLPDTLHSILVNEAMVKHFGWDHAIGKRVTFPGDTSGHYLEVVGVLKDFNQHSLYSEISPLLLFYAPNSNIMQLKMNSGDIKTIVSKAENIWKKYFPQLPFEYKFLDEDFNSQYAADQKRGKIFAAFSVLTILITCLGLLGLTAFTTQQKQKEISIRRVMGASIIQVVALITRNYLWLSLIASCIAFPVAWYFMSNWLHLFQYNTGLSAVPFLLSALVIIITATLTAMFHSSKAALTKPAEILRTE